MPWTVTCGADTGGLLGHGERIVRGGAGSAPRRPRAYADRGPGAVPRPPMSVYETIMAKLIIGCGYLGKRVAALWRRRGHHVRALTRGRAEELCGLGIEPVVGDVRELLDVLALEPADTVLYAVAPDRRAGSATAEEVWIE